MTSGYEFMLSITQVDEKLQALEKKIVSIEQKLDKILACIDPFGQHEYDSRPDQT